MYRKLFAQLYDGTLRTDAPWQALTVFMHLIVLCDPEGVVDMPRKAISLRTGLPIEVVNVGIEALETPDPASRRPDAEGRRIVRLDDHRDWGWQITNFCHYRDLRSNEERREYFRNYQRIRRGSKLVNRDTLTVNEVTEEEGEEEVSKPLGSAAFNLFWHAYPAHRRNDAKAKAYAKWQAKDMGKKAHQIMIALNAFKATEQWKTPSLVPNMSTWINQERWEMSPDVPAQKKVADYL